MNEYKVVVLGDGGVGKSALTVRFVTGKFEEKYDPTIEDFYRKEILVNGKSTMLEILDTAGSEQFASLQDLYIRNGHGFVLVYSITSFHSLLNLEAVYQQILRYKAKFRQRSSTKVDHPSEVPPIILVGNKVDLESTFREVAKEDAENIARRWGCCGFVETSAKNGDGVMDVFRQVVLRMAQDATTKRGCGSGCEIL
ncbi:unnamed protein product [Hymenolepis diminuta]|uniref:Uncharacterized protein n=1 Tax=Hymenolepis diminuta TaxID=6216 RepID=A0A564YQN3_HYMDI|nr:unnamed protein product [Hymenolepis diminuta]